MAGMFDTFFGGPQASAQGGFNPKTMGMLALAGSLLEAGAPSLQPRSVGSGLGRGAQNMFQAQQQAQQAELQKSIFDLQKRDFDRKDAESSRNLMARDRLFTALSNGGTDMGRPVDMKPLWAQAFPDQFASSEFDKLKPKPLVPIAEGGSLYDPNDKKVVAQGAPKMTEFTQKIQALREADPQLSAADAVNQVMRPAPQGYTYQGGKLQVDPNWEATETRLRRAGASRSNVNVNPAKADPLYEVDLDQFKGHLKSVNSGRELVPALTQVAEGLEAGAPSGRIAEMTRPVRQFAQELGWRDDPNLPAEEQVSAAMNYIIPRFRAEGSGSSSNLDINMFQKAAPSYARTPQGNIIVARSLLQMQSRREAELDVMRSYYRQNNNSLDGVGKVIDEKLGPLFPRPKSEQDYAQIKPGTVYLHPERGYVVKR